MKIRTNNNNEIDPALSKIAVLAESYWGNQTSNLIKHRSHAGITYAVYTDFENQERRGRSGIIRSLLITNDCSCDEKVANTYLGY